jgi:hypothetical protein
VGNFTLNLTLEASVCKYGCSTVTIVYKEYAENASARILVSCSSNRYGELNPVVPVEIRISKGARSNKGEGGSFLNLF